MRGNAIINSKNAGNTGLQLLAATPDLHPPSLRRRPSAVPQRPPKMSSFSCWVLPAALLTLLCCPGSAEKAFEVYIWPEQVVVESSRSLEVNCSTNCAQPESGGLETSLTKTLLASQARWCQFLISDISQDTVLLCHFTCLGEQQSKNATISVYHPPKQVILKLQPTSVTIGNPFTIECSVPGVAPLESLTLTLLRGRETLYNQTFEGATVVPQEAVATLNVTAHREDGHHNFSCQAELDLRSRGGGIVRSISEPQVLEVYEPMQDNQMIIIVTVVSVLLFLFVTSVLLCFVFGQHWHQKRTGGETEAQRG
ncbi:intercellular adhesion molecule 2 isoform X4 [Trichechus manatus latirostris]|uniref:Intercellular adhesion molecule 2 isoform X4 n=1 Tax=Trichechus manatus latirostris TaxID=127582 RepID=A0A2Y9QUT8_TRIMA|nr:intercellular adhesion molecule 2 isoform X4 [Trichechus manatus latirostris]